MEFEKKIELSKTISEMVNSITDDEKEVKEEVKDVTDEITDKIDKIWNLKKEKEKKILTILGQMYTGVIIPMELSVRKGEFYYYKRQYSLNLNQVKETLLKNLHGISEKITNSKNLDILEYCLEIWDKDLDNFSSRYDDDNDTKKDFKFEEIEILETEPYYSNNANPSFEIIKVNGLKVYSNGKVKFYYQDNEEEDKQTKTLQTENGMLLNLKFQDKLKELTKDFIKTYDDEIKLRSDELDKIKLKGSHLLMSAELQKGTDDIGGYGS